jgi:hypothetical protein
MSDMYEILNGIVTNPATYVGLAIVGGAILGLRAGDRMRDDVVETYIASFSDNQSDTPKLELVPESEPTSLDTAVNE